MAELGTGPHRSGDIVTELDRTVTSLGPVRAKLISKGMVWSPAHGDTALHGSAFRRVHAPHHAEGRLGGADRGCPARPRPARTPTPRPISLFQPGDKHEPASGRAGAPDTVGEVQG